MSQLRSHVTPDSAQTNAWMQAVCDAHGRPIYRFLLRLTLGDREAAEDLLQEIFLSAHRKLESFRGDAALLLARNATVTIAHSRTPALPELCAQADVLAAAVGRPHMVGAEWGRHGIALQNGMSSSRSLTGVRPRAGAAAPEARGSSPKPPPA